MVDRIDLLTLAGEQLSRAGAANPHGLGES